MSYPFDFRSSWRRPPQGRSRRRRARWAGAWTAWWLAGASRVFSLECAAGAALALALAGVLVLARPAPTEEQAQLDRTHRQLAANLMASLVQADLSRSLAAADSLEALLGPSGVVEPFESVVGEWRQHLPLLQTLALAPGGVVGQVAPSDQAAALTGVRLLEATGSRAPAQQALRSHNMVVGPSRDAAQAPMITGYLPVYRRDGDAALAVAGGRWWGFVTVDLKWPRLDDYLGAAHLVPGDWQAELVDLGPSGSPVPPAAPTLFGGNMPVVTADMELPGRSLRLSLAPRPPGRMTQLWPGFLALLCMTAGLVCTVALNRRRRRVLRRRYLDANLIQAGWTPSFDRAHSRLAAFKRTPGLTVVALLRMPAVGTFQRQGARVADGEQRNWSGSIQGIQRGGDLLLHLQGNDHLLAVHSLPTPDVAARVRRRLRSQATELTRLACGADSPPPFFEAQVIKPARQDVGVVLAKLLGSLHSQRFPAPPGQPAAPPGTE